MKAQIYIIESVKATLYQRRINSPLLLLSFIYFRLRNMAANQIRLRSKQIHFACYFGHARCRFDNIVLTSHSLLPTS